MNLFNDRVRRWEGRLPTRRDSREEVQRGFPRREAYAAARTTALVGRIGENSSPSPQLSRTGRVSERPRKTPGIG